MIANSGFKSISRMEYGHGNAWLVKIYWKHKWYRKSFAWLKNGGREAALLAAVSWRNRKEEEIGKPSTDRVVVGAPKREDMCGISRQTLKQRKHNKVYKYPAYVVYWWPISNGKRCQTSFSIKRYGKKKALKKAMRLRQKKQREYLPPREPVRERTLELTLA